MSSVFLRKKLNKKFIASPSSHLPHRRTEVMTSITFAQVRGDSEIRRKTMNVIDNMIDPFRMCVNTIKWNGDINKKNVCLRLRNAYATRNITTRRYNKTTHIDRLTLNLFDRRNRVLSFCQKKMFYFLLQINWREMNKTKICFGIFSIRLNHIGRLKWNFGLWTVVQPCTYWASKSTQTQRNNNIWMNINNRNWWWKSKTNR